MQLEKTKTLTCWSKTDRRVECDSVKGEKTRKNLHYYFGTEPKDDIKVFDVCLLQKDQFPNW